MTNNLPEQNWAKDTAAVVYTLLFCAHDLPLSVSYPKENLWSNPTLAPKRKTENNTKEKKEKRKPAQLFFSLVP